MTWASKPVYGVGQMNYPAYSLILLFTYAMISGAWHNWPINKWTAICSKWLFWQHHCLWVHFWTLRTKHFQIFGFNSIVPDMLSCYSLRLRWSNIIRSDGKWNFCGFVPINDCRWSLYDIWHPFKTVQRIIDLHAKPILSKPSIANMTIFHHVH